MTETSSTIERRLYIGNLPGRVSPHQIADALCDFKEAAVCVFNPAVRAPRASSFAFVTLSSNEDVEQALEKLAGLKIGNRTISVAKADPNKKREDKDAKDGSEPTSPSTAKDAAESVKSDDAAATEVKAARPARRQLPTSEDTVYVSNIPLETTVEEVNEIFSGFPQAETTIVTKKPRKRRQGNRVITLAGKSYAFVKVGAGNQQKAIDELNGKQFKEEKIVVNKATISPEDLDE